MEESDVIGRGGSLAERYQVTVCHDDCDEPRPRTIELSEGSGHRGMASRLPLSDVLDEVWTRHLEICDCLWLRDLAQTEPALGRCLSAEEILAANQARCEHLARAARASRSGTSPSS